jgi:hypothetical protein
MVNPYYCNDAPSHEHQPDFVDDDPVGCCIHCRADIEEAEDGRWYEIPDGDIVPEGLGMPPFDYA